MDACSGFVFNRRLSAALVLFALLPGLPAAIASPLTSHPRPVFEEANQLSLQPQVLRFKEAIVGQTYTQTVILTNRGRYSMGIWSVQGGNPAFRLHRMQLPLKLGSGQSIAIEVDFIPTRRSALNTAFTITTSHAGRFVLHANGSLADGGLIVSPRNANFGNLQMGLQKAVPITLLNSGSTVQHVSRVLVSGPGFGVGPTSVPMVIEPGESVTFNATFSPQGAGMAVGRIVAETPTSGLAVVLSGQGSASGRFTVSPAQLNFGSVASGSTASLSGTLKAGSSDVTIYSAGITSAEFGLTGLTFPVTIPAGQSRSYQVNFTPGSSGSAAGVLSFQTIGAAMQQNLSGTAVPPSQHRVTLSWNPASSGVVGYNIFRADGTANHFSQINPTPDAETIYLDASVEAGHTYYYVTTAVAANGKQSAFSNQVAVSIP